MIELQSLKDRNYKKTFKLEYHNSNSDGSMLYLIILDRSRTPGHKSFYIST